MFDIAPRGHHLRFYPGAPKSPVSDEMIAAGMDAAFATFATLARDATPEAVVEAVYRAMEAARAKPKPVSDRHRV